MTVLAGFLAVFFRSLVFIGLALGVGGTVFTLVVLRPSRALTLPAASQRRSATLIAAGAFLAAVAQLLALVVTPWSLADEAGSWPLAAFLATGYARAGLVHSVSCLGLACAGLALRNRPQSPAWWRGAAILAISVMASGAWLVHGASRLEHAVPLMMVTTLHQLGSLAWIGGTIHLAAQWRLREIRPAWTGMLARFSPLAMGAVGLVLATGGFLVWQYIGGTGGLVGSAYGTMVVTKALLMGAALLLGGMNFLAIRSRQRGGEGGALFSHVPVFVETEAGIGTSILMAAAALTAQPPAVDVLAEQASPGEVLATFAPKMPQLSLAPLREMIAGASSSLDPYALPTAQQRIQSNFNHNVSGIFVLMLGVAALLAHGNRNRLFRHWPLLFLPFALFLTVFVEPTGWPLGREGFWETLASPEVLQHRLATLLVAGLGLFQWRVQSAKLAGTGWRFAFPLLCWLGGALLLSHSHSVFAVKWAFLIEVSHNIIGLLAVLMGAAFWLELKLPEGLERRLAGYVWPACFMLVGYVLLFYRET